MAKSPLRSTLLSLLKDPLAAAQAEATRLGLPAVGLTCTMTPLELILAMGKLPVRIFPRAESPVRAGAHIQSYFCHLARSALEMSLSGRLAFLEELLLTHTCDTMQGLADVWEHAMATAGVQGPRRVTLFSSATGLASPAALEYQEAELRALAARLAPEGVSNGDLVAAMGSLNEVRSRLALLRHEARGRPGALDTVVRLGLGVAAQVLHPTTTLELIDGAFDELRATPAGRAVPLFLWGGASYSLGLFELLGELGAAVADDETCLYRRFADRRVPVGPDPYGALALRGVAGPGCPALIQRGRDRVPQSLERIRASGAVGVILLTPKFCDPLAFDLVPLTQALAQAAIPHLEVEWEEETGLTGSIRVRVEAFLEQLASRG